MVAGPEGRMVVASIPWHHALAFMPFSMTSPKIIAEPSWADCNQRNARRSQFDGKAVPMAQAAERLEDLSFCPHCRPPLHVPLDVPYHGEARMLLRRMAQQSLLFAWIRLFG